MELVQVQELSHLRSAELEPFGQVGPSLNGSSVEEPLELVCEGQRLGLKLLLPVE